MHLNCGIVALDPGSLAEPRIVEEIVDSIGPNEDGAVRSSFDRKTNHCRDLLDHARPVEANPRRRGRGYFEARAVADILQRTQAAEDFSAAIFSLLRWGRWHVEFVDADHSATPDAAERPKMDVA